MTRLDPLHKTEHPAHRLNWRTSTHCDDTHECVELAAAHQAVAVRDSTDPAGPVITAAVPHWRTLLNQIKRGDHDLP
ncbi:DUF397 domain-containing protein [Actinomadura terrae]|uniref:DUF397 domain-containing protein n=1 Tax=Actinomadura terrae TaxID=604353 RepID=UPI001FA76297|nr:DUF397 domain-containing protein [Actinomadura terrae]